jgi:sulfonate transport system ATP-binding protein
MNAPTEVPAPPLDLSGQPAGVPAAVVADDVRRTFNGRAVLDGINLTIPAGEFVALLGRSGTGKSTLLKAMAGLDSGYDGNLLVPDDRAVVFQEPRLLPWARVLPNVALGLRGADATARARAALVEVGLERHTRAWPVTLSGGEAQRVALARALVREPALLLLDEPFGALDALTRLRMHALLADLCRRHHPAVLLVTHDVDEAVALADRILILDGGRITVDRAVELPSPRGRDDPAATALRHELLTQLGVDI